MAVQIMECCLILKTVIRILSWNDISDGVVSELINRSNPASRLHSKMSPLYYLGCPEADVFELPASIAWQTSSI